MQQKVLDKDKWYLTLVVTTYDEYRQVEYSRFCRDPIEERMEVFKFYKNQKDGQMKVIINGKFLGKIQLHSKVHLKRKNYLKFIYINDSGKRIKFISEYPVSCFIKYSKR